MSSIEYVPHLRAISMSNIPHQEKPDLNRARSYTQSDEHEVAKSYSHLSDSDHIVRHHHMEWDDDESKEIKSLLSHHEHPKEPDAVVVTPFTVSKSIAIMIKEMILSAVIATDHGEKIAIGEKYVIFDQPRPAKSRRNRFSMRSKTAVEKLTQVETMTEFIHKVCYQSQMEYECVVISMIYIQRLVAMSNQEMTLTIGNWKAVTLSCMILSSKVFDDFAMLNGDYTSIFPGLLVSRINELEVTLLESLDHKLWITRREYAEMHFRVQDMIARGVIEEVKLTTSIIEKEITPINNSKEQRSSTLVSTRNSRIEALSNKYRASQRDRADSSDGVRSRGSSNATSAHDAASVAVSRSRAASAEVCRTISDLVHPRNMPLAVVIAGPSEDNPMAPHINSSSAQEESPLKPLLDTSAVPEVTCEDGTSMATPHSADSSPLQTLQSDSRGSTCGCYTRFVSWWRERFRGVKIIPDFHFGHI